jgi:hypothetical protein
VSRPASISSALLAATLLAACSFDWDAYDPRLGGDPADASAATGATSGGGAGGTDGGSGGIGGGGIGGGGGSGAAGSGGSSGAAGSGGGTAGAAGGSGGASGGGTSGGSGTGGSAGVGAGGGSAGSGGSTVQTAVYAPPEVADCIALTNPDPDACQSSTGLGQMAVDSVNSGIQGSPPTAAFLSFSLDNAFAGKQVLSVKLQLTVANETSAASNKSGEVWAVAPFTRPDLYIDVPAKQGTAPLAGDLGAVVPLQVVEWLLPNSSVTAGQSIYLGVFPNSSDGVDYYGTMSLAPATLIVQYQ